MLLDISDTSGSKTFWHRVSLLTHLGASSQYRSRTKIYLHFSELSTLELEDEDEIERHQEPENPYYKWS